MALSNRTWTHGEGPDAGLVGVEFSPALRLRHRVRSVRDVFLRLDEALHGKDKAILRRLMRQGRVTFGPWSYGEPIIYTFPEDRTCLRVGNYSSVGSTILLGGEHPTDRVTTFPHRIWMFMDGAGEDGFPAPTGDTVIGSDVWSCYGAFLKSGVHIGDGAIVAGGAVVIRDVPPYAVVGGNPAKVLKYRFREDQIAELLDVQWWNWPNDEVRAAVPLLAGDDVDAFIAYARERKPATSAPKVSASSTANGRRTSTSSERA
jgi:acetyltransferase-like isoleucine patch superfamily enzyme